MNEHTSGFFEPCGQNISLITV